MPCGASPGAGGLCVNPVPALRSLRCEGRRRPSETRCGADRASPSPGPGNYELLRRAAEAGRDRDRPPTREPNREPRPCPSAAWRPAGCCESRPHCPWRAGTARGLKTRSDLPPAADPLSAPKRGKPTASRRCRATRIHVRTLITRNRHAEGLRFANTYRMGAHRESPVTRSRVSLTIKSCLGGLRSRYTYRMVLRRELPGHNPPPLHSLLRRLGQEPRSGIDPGLEPRRQAQPDRRRRRSANPHSRAGSSVVLQSLAGGSCVAARHRPTCT